MKYSLPHIMRHVRACLNLPVDNSSLIRFDDTPALSIDSLIRECLPEAIRQALLDAPTDVLDTARPLTGAVAWPGRQGVGMAVMALPDDCLRLLTIQMSDWHRPATIIDECHPHYRRQASPFDGVRGNPYRPVAAVVRYPIGRVVELYSSTAGDGVTLRHALYLPMPHFDPDGFIDLPQALFCDIVQRTAQHTRQLIDDNLFS